MDGRNVRTLSDLITTPSREWVVTQLLILSATHTQVRVSLLKNKTINFAERLLLHRNQIRNSIPFWYVSYMSALWHQCLFKRTLTFPLQYLRLHVIINTKAKRSVSYWEISFTAALVILRKPIKIARFARLPVHTHEITRDRINRLLFFDFKTTQNFIKNCQVTSILFRSGNFIYQFKQVRQYLLRYMYTYIRL